MYVLHHTLVYPCVQVHLIKKSRPRKNRTITNNPILMTYISKSIAFKFWKCCKKHGGKWPKDDSCFDMYRGVHRPSLQGVGATHGASRGWGALQVRFRPSVYLQVVRKCTLWPMHTRGHVVGLMMTDFSTK